ncbi:hypothetical protein [Hymenobacter cavernae]|uniref:Uncharacterized protein n=1 Tax=Hymenobacter cavernae TaxID=2044852 RepID=A0ABQ1TR58_9BACT|nr:hypothetical protein [Hymenobacter cavernae]GGE99821.1 hypothetical protein GCM10011383_08360 [Hymenobacter cavernae]
MAYPICLYPATLRHLVCLLVLVFYTYKASAQNPDVIYSAKIVSADERKCLAFVCSSGCENAAALTTENETDYMVLDPALLGASSKVRVQLARSVPADSRAGSIFGILAGVACSATLNTRLASSVGANY